MHLKIIEIFWPFIVLFVLHIFAAEKTTRLGLTSETCSSFMDFFDFLVLVIILALFLLFCFVFML